MSRRKQTATPRISTVIILIIAGVLLTVATASALSALSSSQILPAAGTLTQMNSSVNTAVFVDAACTQNASFVDWGTLSPGVNTTRTFYVKNLGNATSTLSMTTDNWVPTNAYPAIYLSWNQEGNTLAPGMTVQAVLTLSVSAKVDGNITDFTFNIMITGTG